MEHGRPLTSAPYTENLVSFGNEARGCSLSTMLGRWFPNRQARLLAPQELVRVSILLCLILPWSLGGCYWLKYEKLMHTHIELMRAMTDKMSRLLEDKAAVTPSTLNEFLYPLERARDFSRIVAQHYAERPSLSAFNRLLDVYERPHHGGRPPPHSVWQPRRFSVPGPVITRPGSPSRGAAGRGIIRPAVSGRTRPLHEAPRSPVWRHEQDPFRVIKTGQ